MQHPLLRVVRRRSKRAIVRLKAFHLLPKCALAAASKVWCRPGTNQRYFS